MSSRSRTQLWIAAAIFLGPLVAAFVIYRWFPQWLPEGRTNYGKLIDPPRPLPAFTLADPDAKPVNDPWRGHWTLVYVAPAECEQPCRDRVHFSRQLWLALNDKRAKLERAYVAPDVDSAMRAHAALAQEHPDLTWLGGTGTSGYDVRLFFEIVNTESLYLIDPFGNWVMTYAPAPGDAGVQQDFKGMQKDLKKLLAL
jgi:cytochrome oxidase Cu insertion factor (SCO1/SenC/PrrC family)